MSTSLQREPVAEGVAFPGTKLLPYLSLFVRLAIGLSLLDIGLATIMSSGPSPFGGPPGWPPGGWGGPGASSGFPGVGLLVFVLPYAALAIGVGLVFGIFTTVAALMACGLALVFPVLLTLHMVIMGGINTNAMMMTPFGPGGFGPEAGLTLLLIGLGITPGLVALVLLSPPSINRFSVDALMFQRVAPPIVPPAAPPDAGVREPTDRDITGPG